MSARHRPAPPLRQRLLALERHVQGLRRELACSQAALALAQAQARSALDTGRHDALTGLHNRLGFEHQTHQTLARHALNGHLFALLFIDLDGFKAINDQLGHAAGDALLGIVGARLAHAMRSGDAVSRYGGDEFLCLLPELQDETRALAIAQQLERAVSAPCAIAGAQVCVRASIGVALYPRDGATLQELLQRADAAMYEAKRAHVGVALAGQRH